MIVDYSEFTEKEKLKCQYIIHGASAAAAGIGLAPIPGADIGPICAVQAGMIVALAAVFDMSITTEAAAATAKTAIVGNMGKMIVSGILKVVPVLGSGVNATVAAALTETLGWQLAGEYAAKKRQAERKKAEEKKLEKK